MRSVLSLRCAAASVALLAALPCRIEAGAARVASQAEAVRGSALLLVGADAVGTPPFVQLTEEATLTQWRAADAADRSRVAVEIARRLLGQEADRLAVAKAAMEITGCVSRTARDARFGAWKVGATAATCLTAPEKPAGRAPR
jgi:hypothetical protein